MLQKKSLLINVKERQKKAVMVLETHFKMWDTKNNNDYHTYQVRILNSLERFENVSFI